MVSLLLRLFRGPSSTPQVSDGHEEDKGIRGWPFRTKISLDTSISRTSISGRREYKISVKNKSKKETNIPFAIIFLEFSTPFDITFNKH